MTITITIPDPKNAPAKARTIKNNAKTKFENMRYERSIKKSQKKIGEYVPTPYCKTITA